VLALPASAPGFAMLDECRNQRHGTTTCSFPCVPTPPLHVLVPNFTCSIANIFRYTRPFHQCAIP
jgi:hypothetical protein